jgi:aminoglycoside phosphotransferase family enzyme
MDSDIQEPHGYYKIIPKNGPVLFLKVTSTRAKNFLLKVEDLVTIIKEESSVSVSPLLKHISITASNIEIFVFEHIPHRYAKNSLKDLKKLNNEISSLHLFYQNTTSVRLDHHRMYAKKNGQRLDDNIRTIFNHINPYSNIPIDVKTFIKEHKHLYLNYSAEYLKKARSGTNNAQMVHGDLNFGNALISCTNKEYPVLIDFEDSLLSWLPPQVDLAFFLERFLILKKIDDDKKVEWAQTLLEQYASSTGQFPFCFVDELEKTLKFLSIRALGRLCLNAKVRINSSEDEWQKFIDLYKRSSQLSDLIASFTLPFLSK